MINYSKMEKIFQNPIIRLIAVIGILLLFRFSANELAELINDSIQRNVNNEFDYKSEIYKFLMVAFTFIIMIIMPGYTLKDFGFRKPGKVNYFKIVWLTFVIVIAGMILFGFLYMGILKEIFGSGTESSGGFDVSNQSIISIILGIWLWSSFTEEFYMRGFFQSLLDNLKKYKFIRLSAVVWASGLTFGLIHLSIYNGDNLFFTLYIVTQAAIMGTLAAYYREKAKSIYPAILVHVLANIYGSIPLLFQ